MLWEIYLNVHVQNVSERNAFRKAVVCGADLGICCKYQGFEVIHSPTILQTDIYKPHADLGTD